VHRWYRGEWGRYTQADPLNVAGHNLYAYADGNAIGRRDPLGLISSAGGCACCSDEGIANEFRKIVAYVRANKRMYTPHRFLRRGGCGGAADSLQIAIERDVNPQCWITKSQLMQYDNLANRVGLKFWGVNVVVHRVVRLRPCRNTREFNIDLGIDAYHEFSEPSVGPLGDSDFPWPSSNPIEDVTQPFCN
jgi:hypothetical protein